MGNLIRINNKSLDHKPKNENNFVVHSKLNSFHSGTKTSPLSVKMVLEGTERYKVNNRRYDLRANEFLLVENDTELEISFDDTKQAEGICLYFDERYLKQHITLKEKGEKWSLDNNDGCSNYDFISTKGKLNENAFGLKLRDISGIIRNEKIHTLSDDFFLDLAEELVVHQKGIMNELNSLSSVKLATRKELYCRTLLARDYIEENLCTNKTLDIKNLSLISTLSEVQLHRTFKQVFQVSPYQYVLELKLNKSIDLMKSGEYSLLEISSMLNFADLPTFSKAFKRKFAISPRSFQKEN